LRIENLAKNKKMVSVYYCIMQIQHITQKGSTSSFIYLYLYTKILN